MIKLINSPELCIIRAGHDHCQMHIKDDTKGTNYLVTGSGEFVTYEMDKDNEVPSGWLKYILSTDNNPTHAQSGFSSFSATSEKMTVSIKHCDFICNVIIFL